MWLAFGAGVAATLTIEFLLAHYFKWSTDRQIAKADAALQTLKADKPWFVKMEQAAVADFKAVENTVEGFFHKTPAPQTVGLVVPVGAAVATNSTNVIVSSNSAPTS